jgi:thiosulfate/3-mercaptopyruvate sulfurtransferase
MSFCSGICYVSKIPEHFSLYAGAYMKIGKFLFFPILFVVLIMSSGSVSFANDLGLIEPHVLNENLSKWVILDARPKSEWMAGHIPGAISFSWENYTKKDEEGIPYRVWPPQKMAEELGKLGIDEKSPIVVYGDAEKSWGGEGWSCWLLSWLGHKGPVRLLNGGIQAWRSHKFLMAQDSEKTKSKPVQYQVNLQLHLDISTADLKKQQKDFSLIDTRSTLERFKGRIPGSIHIEWKDFFTGADRKPLAPDALKKLLQKHDIDIRKPVVYYCSGGIRSSYAWLVHQLAGLPAAKNYEGGYEAWKRL